MSSERVSPARHAAVRGELFSHRLMAIAREMGEVLQRTALSTNVKERLDFSCGILDSEGRLAVNAPHVPVHLGALGLAVRGLVEVLDLGPEDVAITNHPAFGGSHLPDVTMVAPVYLDDELLGYVANRAHHAEIGGIRPGSMPPDATCLAEEGVVLEPQLLVADGRPRWEAVEERLRSAAFPSRAVGENLADLRGALAATRRGARRLRELAAASSPGAIASAMAALHEQAAFSLQRRLERLEGLDRAAVERLDDGTPIRVRVRVEGGRARFDFAGTAASHSGNLNATRAIVQSAVLYVLRLLVEDELPLNEGLLEVVDIHLPRCFLDPEIDADPRRAPAVVGGNVETSQRVVDALLSALELVACSQGTMNNLVFGDDRFGYYETLCGGAGAGPSGDGASALHTHMTNTRITDPEILEWRYPVRLEEFSVRAGSGGAGRHRGGDGVRRRLRFLEPVTVSLLTQHRVEAPYGLAGGRPGARGRQRLLRADGSVEELGGIALVEVERGDAIEVETPGGGGWGPVESEVVGEE